MPDVVLFPDDKLRGGLNRSTDVSLYPDGNLRAQGLYAPAQATGGATIVGSANLINAASVLGASGTVTVSGNATLTSGASVLGASGAVSVSGNASLTNEDSALSASGDTSVSGDASLVNEDSALSASGAVTVTGNAVLVNSPSTLIATGTTGGVVPVVPSYGYAGGGGSYEDIFRRPVERVRELTKDEIRMKREEEEIIFL